jgi:hypothetical protein
MELNISIFEITKNYIEGEKTKNGRKTVTKYLMQMRINEYVKVCKLSNRTGPMWEVGREGVIYIKAYSLADYKIVGKSTQVKSFV